jgi:PII-like signaling protein
MALNAGDETGRAERYQRVALAGTAWRLTIFVDETDRYGHHPLYTEIVQRAHRRGLAGATVLRGMEGYGASNHISTTRLLTLSEDLPLMLVIIDAPDRIDAFLPELDEILGDGLVVIDEVKVVHYSGRRPASTQP